MSEELKPCPFCGGRAYTHGRPGLLGTWNAYVECNQCTTLAQCRDSTGEIDKAEALAIERWNRRAGNV